MPNYRWIKLSSPQVVLNAPNVRPLRMMYSPVIPWDWSVDRMFDEKVPVGVRHLVFNCHGFATRPNFKTPHLSIGTVIHLGNVSAFRKLFPKIDLQVIWIAACSIAQTATGQMFCRKMAELSGCFVVAPSFATPMINGGPGVIHDYQRSLPIYIAPPGHLMSRADFFKKGADLGFQLL